MLSGDAGPRVCYHYQFCNIQESSCLICKLVFARSTNNGLIESISVWSYLRVTSLCPCFVQGSFDRLFICFSFPKQSEIPSVSLSWAELVLYWKGEQYKVMLMAPFTYCLFFGFLWRHNTGFTNKISASYVAYSSSLRNFTCLTLLSEVLTTVSSVIQNSFLSRGLLDEKVSLGNGWLYLKDQS